MQNSKGALIWIIIIIVLLVLGTWLIVRNNDTETMPEENTETTMNTVENKLAVKDQFPGDIAFVSDLSLRDAGFVAIHKDNAGAPGEIIGTKYFEKGSTVVGQVNLTQKTENGKTYYAMLHTDDGDKVFDASKDLPAKDAAGMNVMKSFKATTVLDGTKG